MDMQVDNIMKAKNCVNCGATHHFDWGEGLCFICAKETKDSPVLPEKTVGALKEDGFVLCNSCHQYWTTKSNGGKCFNCVLDSPHQEGYEINEEGYMVKKTWEYRTKDCTFCVKHWVHTVAQHSEALDSYDKVQNWKTHKIGHQIPIHNHMISEKCNGLCPAWCPPYMQESDTSQGHKGPISINTPTDFTTVVSEIRPFTLADKYEGANRGMYAAETKKKYPILAKDGNIGGPAKPAPHVTDEDVESEKKKLLDALDNINQTTWIQLMNSSYSEQEQQYWKGYQKGYKKP
jgi:hypothetical protein